MKIFKFILIIVLALQVAFGADEKLNFLADKNDGYVSGRQCTWECREVQDGYGTRIIDFDFQNGRTICEVFNSATGEYIGDGSKTNKDCSLAENIDEKSADEYLKILEEGHGSSGSNITYQKQGGIKMSQFMVALVTLDPSIIDKQETSKKGEIKIIGEDKALFNITNVTRKSQFSMDNYVHIEFISKGKDLVNKALNLQGLDAYSYSENTTNMLDGFNKNNMAYFNDLFTAMETIYQHLQVFIFVLIGGFFVMQIGASKLQAYLENRGESEGKQPYLHKFYIPLLMLGIFFMPIPEGNGHQSTVMQNMIRYFAQYSTTLADMTNSIGAETYINKIYATAGHLSPEKLDKLKKERENAKKETEFYKQVVEVDNADIGEKCFNSRGQQYTTYVGSHGGSIKYDNNGQVFYSCLDYGKDIMRFNEAATNLNRLDNELKFISLYSSQYGNTLNKIDEYLTARNKELGWIDIIMTPTAGILVEIFTLSQITEAMKNHQKENIVERQIAIKQYFNNGNLEQSKKMLKIRLDLKQK